MRIIKLTPEDGIDVYEMLQDIDNEENSFTNPVKGKSFDQFKSWLRQQAQWDKGENLPDGYVRQSIYWLYDSGKPVGIGKIRHELTKRSKISGGNIGYAISHQYRGKGYGSQLLKMLIQEARALGIQEVLLTVDLGNNASRHICENNGAVMISSDSNRWYFQINER